MLKQKLTVIASLNLLLTELKQHTRQVESKKMEISRITGHHKLIGVLEPEVEAQTETLHQEIERLYQVKIIPLKEKIIQLNPF